MNASPVIATAATADMFWLVKGLVLSLVAPRARAGAAMVCFDLGLEPVQRDWLAARGVATPAPVDPLGGQANEGFDGRMSALLLRPFLPELLAGHDTIIWLDADTWLQDPAALADLLHITRYGQLAICPEIHIAYSNMGLAARNHHAYWKREWTAAFGADAAARFAHTPVLNCGVFAAPASHPIWGRWAAEYRIAMQRRLTFLADQLAFNRAAADLPGVERVPALWNWMCNYAMPRWHAQAARWIQPGFPHDPIRILHLAGAVMRPRYLRRNLLFDRGRYLDPHDVPAAIRAGAEKAEAPPPPVA